MPPFPGIPADRPLVTEQNPITADKAALSGKRILLIVAGGIAAFKTPEEIFAKGTRAASDDAEARQAELFEQIGRLKMELEWLKKKVGPLA